MSSELLKFILVFITLGGFSIGLGTVTVMDFCGLLGQKSAYWTKTAIRLHHLTRYLIWLSYITIIIGKSLLYFYIPNSTQWFEFYILAVIGLNALFLFFVVGPYLVKREKEDKDEELLPADFQKRVLLSFVISFLAWWSSFAITVYDILSL